MDVLVGLEFEDSETAVEGAGEHVDHGAVGGGEGGNLRVDEALVEAFVDGADVANDRRLQPALGTGTENRIALDAMSLAVLGETRNQFAEERFVGFVERIFGGPESEADDFVVAE